MRHTLTHKIADEDVTCWEKEYPVTVLQFILFLYHNQPDFAAQCASPEFLGALASTLFTYKTSSEANSEVGTPVEELKVRWVCASISERTGFIDCI